MNTSSRTTKTPETSGHLSTALRAIARHTTNLYFPDSRTVFLKIKEIMSEKNTNTDKIPQITKLLEQMQVAYGTRINNLITAVNEGFIRIRDAHNEVQQILHEITVFKGEEMPEEVAAVSEAIKAMCGMISEKVESVRNIYTPQIISVKPEKLPKPPETKNEGGIWGEEIVKHTKGDTLTRKLLLEIAKEGGEGRAVSRATLANMFNIEPKVVRYTLQNWRAATKKQELPFILDTSDPCKIHAKGELAAAGVDTPASGVEDNIDNSGNKKTFSRKSRVDRAAASPESSIAPGEPLTADTSPEHQVGKWLKETEESTKSVPIQQALARIITNHERETTWEELTGIMKCEKIQAHKALGNWRNRGGKNASFRLELSIQSGVRIISKNGNAAGPATADFPADEEEVAETASIEPGLDDREERVDDVILAAGPTGEAVRAEPAPPEPESQVSGYQGKAMIWISKLAPSRITEKVAYERLAKNFGAEVTREELTVVETVHNRERRLNRVDITSFLYRLDNKLIDFSEMPFTIEKTANGYMMVEKGKKDAAKNGKSGKEGADDKGEKAPLTPEEEKKVKAIQWFERLYIDPGSMMYTFIKKLAENPGVKISDKVILEMLRPMYPKGTAEGLYGAFIDFKKRGKVKNATYPLSNYMLDVEQKSGKNDEADKYWYKLYEVRPTM